MEGSKSIRKHANSVKLSYAFIDIDDKQSI